MAKQPSPKVLDIVFVGILASAAVLLFLLSGSRSKEAIPAPLSPTPTAAPTEAGAPEPSPFTGNDLALWLEEQGLRVVEHDSRSHTIVLRDGERDGRMTLTYDQSGEWVYGWLLAFPLYQPEAAPEGDAFLLPLWEESRAQRDQAEKALESAALQRELKALLSAASQSFPLPGAITDQWIQAALALRTERGVYEDKYQSALFRAEYRDEDGKALMYLSLILPIR